MNRRRTRRKVIETLPRIACILCAFEKRCREELHGRSAPAVTSSRLNWFHRLRQGPSFISVPRPSKSRSPRYQSSGNVGDDVRRVAQTEWSADSLVRAVESTE